MAKFWIGFSGFATATANKSMAKVIGAAARRIECVELGAFGAGGVAPADIQHNINAGFLTNATAGTPGASPTPEKMDMGSAVSGVTAGVAYSAESTAFAANVFQLFSFNQRGGMRWAVPEGAGFRTDGTQTNLSFAARVISSVAGTIDGNMMWHE